MSLLTDGNSPSNNATLSSINWEYHLRRELEEGNITLNDFERTKRFFSRNHVIYRTTIATGILASGLSTYYGRWYRRQPWSWRGTLVLAPVAFVAGMIPGICFQTLRAFRFQAGLEDQQGLITTMKRIIRQHRANANGDHKVEDALEGQADMSTNSQSDGVQRNRWTELRNASVSASNSKWDKIRQSHERSGTPPASSPGQESQIGSEKPGVDDRQTEQAEFDALLEAERKMSS